MTWNDLPPAFHFDFWFHLQALPFTPWIAKTIQIVMLAFLIVSVVSYVLVECSARHIKNFHQIFSKLHRRFLRRVSLFAFLAAVSGYSLYWFTIQDVPVLSMRFWFIVWFVITVIWARYLMRDYRRLKFLQEETEARAGYEKWLPKPKK